MKPKKRKVGRPKMPKNTQKIHISLRLTPELMNAIEEETKGKNRNHEIEKVLAKKYLVKND